MTVEPILLDTNVLLCFLMEPERLPKNTIERVANGANRVLFSVASLWEVAIKQALRRADFDFAAENVHTLAQETGFALLDITPAHIFRLSGLPLLHRDPFDRMLVAQSLSEGLRFLTTDAMLSAYSSSVEVAELREFPRPTYALCTTYHEVD